MGTLGDEKEGVSEAFELCMAHRRFARRATRLPEGLCGERTKLIEDMLELANSLDVWAGGLVESTALAIVFLYEDSDESAARVLNGLANQELGELTENAPEWDGLGGGQRGDGADP